MDILDDFIATDNKLVDWILHVTPTTDAEKQDLRRVFAQRDTLNQQINALVLRRLQLAVTDVTAQAQQVHDLTQNISDTVQNISTVKDVIGVVAQVISLAADVITLVAA